jgi:hypothetical protein
MYSQTYLFAGSEVEGLQVGSSDRGRAIFEGSGVEVWKVAHTRELGWRQPHGGLALGDAWFVSPVWVVGHTSLSGVRMRVRITCLGCRTYEFEWSKYTCLYHLFGL